MLPTTTAWPRQIPTTTAEAGNPPGSGSVGASASGSPTTKHAWAIEALGDSVPHGTSCDCTPYPELTGAELTAPPDRTVTVTNDAVGGYTTADVLAQLESNAPVIDHVRTADVVEIEIGANDVAYSSTCGTSVACYQPTLPVVEKNLAEIVARVHDLTAGHQVLVVLLDYWSVWLGGQYAAAQGDAYVTAATDVTDQVNALIKATASTTSSAYVDLRAAFKGPDYTYDETHYLAPDGDHPNAAGHQQIAAATITVIETTLHI